MVHEGRVLSQHRRPQGGGDLRACTNTLCSSHGAAMLTVSNGLLCHSKPDGRLDVRLQGGASCLWGRLT